MGGKEDDVLFWAFCEMLVLFCVKLSLRLNVEN